MVLCRTFLLLLLLVIEYSSPYIEDWYCRIHPTAIPPQPRVGPAALSDDSINYVSNVFSFIYLGLIRLSLIYVSSDE